MSTQPRIVYCHCAYAQVVPADVKQDVLRRLSESGTSFDAVADLCESKCERGLGTYSWMTGYPNLYYQTRLDKKLPDETERLGWLTTRPVKEAMLSRLAEAIDRRDITVCDRISLLELQGLVWDADNRCFRQNYKRPGEKLTHDDSVIALAIANEMRRAATGNRFLAGRPKTSGDF